MLITHEDLFLGTISDLRKRLEEETTYNLVRSAGICRHLLLDQMPLAMAVCKKFNYKLKCQDSLQTPTTREVTLRRKNSQKSKRKRRRPSASFAGVDPVGALPGLAGVGVEVSATASL